jgi:hypothetical protein
MRSPVYTLEFNQITLKDIAHVGGKNALLGELFNSPGCSAFRCLAAHAITINAPVEEIWAWLAQIRQDDGIKQRAERERAPQRSIEERDELWRRCELTFFTARRK